MRLDEWQRYIDSEFVEARATQSSPPEAAQAPSAPSPDNGISSGADGETAPADHPRDSMGEAVPVSADSVITSDPTMPAGVDLNQGSGADAECDAVAPGHGAAIPMAARMREQVVPGIITTSTIDAAILPFADYIAGKRGRAGQPLAPGSQDSQLRTESAPDPLHSAPDTADPDDAGTADGWEPALAGRYPLTAPSAVLDRLRATSGNNASQEDAAMSRRREAMARRLLDPVLSIEEAALYLAVAAPVIRQYAEDGTLASCEPPPESGRERDQSSNLETRQPGFRLSDIARFLDAHGTSPRTEAPDVQG